MGGRCWEREWTLRYHGKSDRCFCAAAAALCVCVWNSVKWRSRQGVFIQPDLSTYCLDFAALSNESWPCYGSVILPGAVCWDFVVNLSDRVSCVSCNSGIKATASNYFHYRLIFWYCFVQEDVLRCLVLSSPGWETEKSSKSSIFFQLSEARSQWQHRTIPSDSSNACSTHSSSCWTHRCCVEIQTAAVSRVRLLGPRPPASPWTSVTTSGKEWCHVLTWMWLIERACVC